MCDPLFFLLERFRCGLFVFDVFMAVEAWVFAVKGHVGGGKDIAGVLKSEAFHGLIEWEPFVAVVLVGELDFGCAGMADEVGDDFVDVAFFVGVEGVAHVFLEACDAVDLADAGFFAEFADGGLPGGFAVFEVALGVVPVFAVVEEEVEA